jgi:hypothetical protein
MSCSDRIVRVTYPKNCSPEVDDSQQLLYNGPALSCIDVQTNQTLNDAIKEIDQLICQTLNNLTTSTSSTTTSTTTCYTKECFFSLGGGAFEILPPPPPKGCEFGPIEFEIVCEFLCFTILIEAGPQVLTMPEGGTGTYNGRPYYLLLPNYASNASAIYWTGTQWAITPKWNTDKAPDYILPFDIPYPISIGTDWIMAPGGVEAVGVFSITEGSCSTTTSTTSTPVSCNCEYHLPLPIDNNSISWEGITITGNGVNLTTLLFNSGSLPWCPEIAYNSETVFSAGTAGLNTNGGTYVMTFSSPITEFTFRCLNLSVGIGGYLENYTVTTNTSNPQLIGCNLCKVTIEGNVFRTETPPSPLPVEGWEGSAIIKVKSIVPFTSCTIDGSINVGKATAGTFLDICSTTPPPPGTSTTTTTSSTTQAPIPGVYTIFTHFDTF